MSDQQRDILYYNKEEYKIIAKHGDGLFALPRTNRALQFCSAANPDGYYCEYVISADNSLFLKQLNLLYPDKQLEVNGVKGEYVESINEADLTIKEKFERYMGVKPSPEIEKREEYGGMHIFPDVYLAMQQFCGKLLIGSNFDWTYHIPDIGFQKAWAYLQVFELHFEGGKIIKSIELSECAKRLREIFCDISEEKDTTIIQKKLAEWNQIISNNGFSHFWEYVAKRRVWGA